MKISPGPLRPLSKYSVSPSAERDGDASSPVELIPTSSTGESNVIEPTGRDAYHKSRPPVPPARSLPKITARPSADTAGESSSTLVDSSGTMLALLHGPNVQRVAPSSAPSPLSSLAAIGSNQSLPHAASGRSVDPINLCAHATRRFYPTRVKANRAMT